MERGLSLQQVQEGDHTWVRDRSDNEGQESLPPWGHVYQPRGKKAIEALRGSTLQLSILRALEPYVGAAPALPSAYWGGCAGIR